MLTPCVPIESNEDTLTIDLDTSMASSNWMQLGRLKKKAKGGDEEAQKEVDRMNKSALGSDSG